MFGGCTFGVGFVASAAGIVPLIIGLKRVFEYANVTDYSFFPLIQGLACVTFLMALFHSFGYFAIIAADTSVKEKSELRK
jgi:hypothetical protein